VLITRVLTTDCVVMPTEVYTNHINFPQGKDYSMDYLIYILLVLTENELSMIVVTSMLRTLLFYMQCNV